MNYPSIAFAAVASQQAASRFAGPMAQVHGRRCFSIVHLYQNLQSISPARPARLRQPDPPEQHGWPGKAVLAGRLGGPRWGWFSLAHSQYPGHLEVPFFTWNPKSHI